MSKLSTMKGSRAERRKALDQVRSELKYMRHDASEDGHIQADDLLTTALRILSDGEWSESYVSDIIHEYDSIGKWYA